MALSMRRLERRRADSGISSFLHGEKEQFDLKTGHRIIKIISGEWQVSAHPNDMLTTILGSCVSACVRDPVTGVGGMNHFMLPGNENTISSLSDAARYGTYAMECLINEILKRGGRRERLEIKVFGGGNVMNHSSKIGSQNAAFIREFMRREGFIIHCEDLEGDLPRRVHYFPYSGKVMVRKLRRREDLVVVEEEVRYRSHIAGQTMEGAIELF